LIIHPTLCTSDMLHSHDAPHPDIYTLSLHDALPILSSLPAGAASAFGRRPTIPGAEGLGIDPPESPPRTAQGRAAICRRDQGRLLTAGSCGAHRCVAVAGGQPEAGIRAAPGNAAILDALRARANAIGHGR